jgi:hypothetical protein
VQLHNQSRLAVVLNRLGLAERRSPRWVDEARSGRLVEYERANSTHVVR